MQESNNVNAQRRFAALRRSGLINSAGNKHFAALSEHVRVMLDVPVAIISLVEEDRQVFAGQCGLPEPWATRGETPLSHSFCQHVVDRSEPLIIMDAREEPLVRGNLAIPDIGVIAYLGVPILLPTGECIGALAAIDTVPHRWTSHNLRVLQSLAQVLENNISVTVSEHKFRRLFEDMQEGYYVAEAVRDDEGRLTDMVFEEVNPAFERLTGLSVESVLGQRLSRLVPAALDDMLPAYEQVLSTGDVVIHANRTDLLGGRWYENRIRRLDETRVASIFSDVTDRKRAEDRLVASEIHWRSLFERLHEGFILGEVIRDGQGRVVDWRCRKVNRAFGELMGVAAERAMGETIRTVLPEANETWMDRVQAAVDSGAPTVFTGPAGTSGRWFEAHAQPFGDDCFVALFVDVTERLKMESVLRDRERQLRTVVETVPLGVLLAEAPSGRIIMQNRRLVQMLGQDAMEATSMDRYSIFNARDAEGRRVPPEDYPLSRIVTGQCESAGLELLYQRRDGSETWLSVSAEAVHDAGGALTGAVVAVSDISDRKRAEAEQTLINREISHRLKNTLAMVQAIASQTLKRVPDRQLVQSFERRLHALSSAHDVLFARNASSAAVETLVGSTLSRIAPVDRFDISGPDVEVGPKGTLSLALLVHEMGTNAVKYGALSNEEGRVALAWVIEGQGDEAVFRLTWQERGGPLVSPPDQRGFGSKLIGMGLVGAGQVETRFDPEGFSASMAADLARLRQTD
ncbi:PAS domain S-box protein [Rhizobium sp. YIM 134829]|uniref:PAS domain S-box protein n=1 Tax=Rhizobium sp. YIM 134829 TaxID=3390453 RepID=UPI00397CFE08